ncbi:uncharacterized protein LOC120187426, partial [Hibiscus syriacus]|uniref:uncharacterized protein LOC120187426 n=1 Tax=Hibiscus syriacus TaxID=106335 RepID=UPI001923DB96
RAAIGGVHGVVRNGISDLRSDGFAGDRLPGVVSSVETKLRGGVPRLLMVEKPHFFVALVWMELTFQWPLALLNIYGILASKPWFNTTCLIYGVSAITTMTAVLGELIGSQKGSEKLVQTHAVFMGVGALAMIRGLLPQSCKVPTIGKRPAARKKRA